MKLRKKVSLFLIFIMTLLINIDYVLCLEGIVNGTDVRIRSGAGTSYVSLLDDAGISKKYTLLDSKLYPTSDGTTGCDTGKWYKVSYNNQVGYICSSFLNVSTNTEGDNSTSSSITLGKSSGVIACYEDTSDLTFRSSPGSGNLGYLKCGDVVEILDTDVSTNGGCYSWYKIKKDNVTGYVCGKFVTTTSLSKKALAFYQTNSLEEYKKSLKDKGFPDSYISYLAELHARYPKWKFEPLKIDLDYSTVTSIESAVGISLIQDREGYRSTAGGSYNYYTDTFSALDGSNWYAANHATVSYYMDPRLYLKPNYVFMFEKLTFDSKYHTKDKVELILSSTRLKDYDSKYADYYMDAASKYNVSPIHLASRTRQEVGTTTSVISGSPFDYNGKKYSGLYNAYNIGATSGVDNWKKGLIYANGGEDGTNKSTYYGRPWNSLEKAIVGGGQFISEGYINNNQDTAYLQKFNVNNGKSKIGVHQYMTNVRAPLGEANSTYSAYSSFDMLDNEFVFSIPVYKNMEDMYLLPKSGNPNNYLSELKINGSSVTGFDGSVNSYDIYVSSSTSDVKLSCKTVNSGARITGSVTGTGNAEGTVKINEGKNIIKIDVTAANGSVRTYTLNIHRENKDDDKIDNSNGTLNNGNTGSNDNSNNIEKPTDSNTSSEVDLSTVIGKSGYKINNNFINGININTGPSSIINSIKKNDADVNVVVKNSKGNIVNDGFVGTGYIIEVSKGDKTIKYDVVIYGDASGDGKINALDLLKVQKHILGLSKLNGSYLSAANSSKDKENIVNALDLLKIQKHILGVNSISQ